jgi:hypothetical protein
MSWKGLVVVRAAGDLVDGRVDEAEAASGVLVGEGANVQSNQPPTIAARARGMTATTPALTATREATAAALG